MTPALVLAAAVLCDGGRPAMPVTVGPRASQRSRAAAADLAASLGRVCGAPFSVEAGDGTRGIALGTADDFPALGLSSAFDAEEPMRREQYVLRSHKDGLVAVGATDAAVEAAVADLLHRAGWRRYFPGPSWEVVPRDPGLRLEADVKTAPSFAARRIWYGFGLSDHNAEAFREWQRRNRVPGGFDLRTGHSFESLIERHKAEFDAHPEFFALTGGRRSGTKLCLSNPALRRLVVEDALSLLAAEPARDTVSVEPSDGDGWCECEACRAAGSPSDRVLLLANEVSEGIRKHAPGRYAAFYAYHRHAAPPQREQVGPGVIVSVATSFLPKGRTPEEFLEGWRSRGAAVLGLREYYGVFQWHRSLPGRMRGADLSYLSSSLPRYHSLGVRFVSAESGEDWGANGLGYYAASRMLWDLSEAGRADAIREDFLSRSFGAAREPMDRFYSLLDGSRRLPKTTVPGGMVSEMYRLLADARGRTEDPAVMARLDDLVLYARYVELHEKYRASVLGRQAAFSALVRHARRMRGRMMVHVKALLKDVPRRDASVVVPADDGSGDYSRAEVEEILRR